jgi:hypothetical protein
MSLIKQTKTNTHNKKSKRKLVNTSVLPIGKSYIDLLPDDVLTCIYGFKHQLEFIDSVNLVSKLKVALDSEIVDTRIPIKKLLQKATDKKLIYIDALAFDNTAFDNNKHNKDKLFKIGLNPNKIQLHRGMYCLCQLEIKFSEKVNLLVIDILNILYVLGLTKRTDKTLVDIISDNSSRSSVISLRLN